jgi:hypothetical protein
MDDVVGAVMNDIEREAIILNHAWGMIDNMVNWANFVKNNLSEPTYLLFETGEHARLFIILLGDFLSQIGANMKESVPFDLNRVPSNARPSDRTFLFHLRKVCNGPKLGTETLPLSQVVEGFASWLEAEFIAKGVNLGAIGLVADLPITRIRYLKLCGDIAKHNLARLNVDVGILRKLLKAAGHDVSEQEAYLAVEGFYQWFQDDVFNYHSSQIAEFLNNIRWSMFEYLQPEFERSWHLTDEATTDFPAYGYRVPPEVTEPAARAMYWDLMNRVRSKPYVQRFVVNDYLKRRY